MCAASPQMNTRPRRKRSATSLRAIQSSRLTTWALELASDTQNQAQALIAVNRLERSLVGPQVVVYQPDLVAVDRAHRPAPSRIQRAGGPGWLGIHPGSQIARSNTGRLHTLHDRIASERGADLPTNTRTPAIAAHHVGAGDLDGFTARNVDGPGYDVVSPLIKSRSPAPLQNAHTIHGAGVLEKGGLEIDLVDAVWRFRRRPPRIGPSGRGVALSPARDRDSCELGARHSGAIRDVVREVRRQPGVAQPGRLRRDGERSPCFAPRHGCTLTPGGSSGRLVSTMVTSMPRQARSMASVRPTGPAPTIKTPVSILVVLVVICVRATDGSFQ